MLLYATADTMLLLLLPVIAALLSHYRTYSWYSSSTVALNQSTVSLVRLPLTHILLLHHSTPLTPLPAPLAHSSASDHPHLPLLLIADTAAVEFASPSHVLVLGI